jgi:hypothetical protein
MIQKKYIHYCALLPICKAFTGPMKFLKDGAAHNCNPAASLIPEFPGGKRDKLKVTGKKGYRKEVTGYRTLAFYSASRRTTDNPTHLSLPATRWLLSPGHRIHNCYYAVLPISKVYTGPPKVFLGGQLHRCETPAEHWHCCDKYTVWDYCKAACWVAL